MKKTILLCILLALSSCATKKIMIGDNEAKKDGEFALSSTFIKVKGKLFAGEFALRNLNDKKSVIILLSDIKCKWGDQTGHVKNDRPFNIGEKTINIHVLGVKNAKLKCEVPKKGSGEMQLIVKRIYNNVNHDGKSLGKVLTKDFVWKHSL